MAQKYLLVPLASGIFKNYDLITRSVIGALYDRTRLSNYNLIGDPEGRRFYDANRDQVYCVFTHAELAELLGVGERTVRRSLKLLRDDGLIDSKKVTYKGACRYFLHERIMQELRSQ